MIGSGQILDGYRLIRPIGRGGFGEVWLCQVEATAEMKALKFLPSSDPGQLERELASLIRYRSVTSEIQCPNLIVVEHINRISDGLFYVMPLANGLTDTLPEDPSWCPKTLAAVILQRMTVPQWFTPEEVQGIIIPLINAVQRLSDVGVVHRDIKPENILFIGGRPCLGDVSLLTDDGVAITRRGTPGYAAPSWYLETSGNPDMWGVATTLYTLLTGNAPDKLGRAAFLWPPQGKQSVDGQIWDHLHQIVLRATHEKASERYLRFDALASALQDLYSVDKRHSDKKIAKWGPSLVLVTGMLVVIMAASGIFFRRLPNPSSTLLSVKQPSTAIAPPVVATATPAITPRHSPGRWRLWDPTPVEATPTPVEVAATPAITPRHSPGRWRLWDPTPAEATPTPAEATPTPVEAAKAPIKTATTFEQKLNQAIADFDNAYKEVPFACGLTQKDKECTDKAQRLLREFHDLTAHKNQVSFLEVKRTLEEIKSTAPGIYEIDKRLRLTASGNFISRLEDLASKPERMAENADQFFKAHKVQISLYNRANRAMSDLTVRQGEIMTLIVGMASDSYAKDLGISQAEAMELNQISDRIYAILDGK